MSQKRPTFGLL